MTTLEGLAVNLAVMIVRRCMDAVMPSEKDAIGLIVDPKARAFAEFMCSRHNARIHTKDNLLMQIAAAGFDVADVFMDGIPTGDAFRRKYATTIGPEIFIPEELLTGDGQELIVLVTHECEHVSQFFRYHLAFCWLYSSEAEARASYEANAYGAGEEVKHFFGMPHADPHALLPDLVAAYAVLEQDQHLAEVMMQSFHQSASAGICTTLAGKDAVAWLRRNQ